MIAVGFVVTKRIRIVAFGKIKESYLLEGIQEYAKRLSPFCNLELVELKDEGLEKEAVKLEKYLGPNTFVLDVEGKEMSSLEFAAFVKKHEGDFTLIVGGADGIDPSVKKKTSLISLSAMTFTHEMSRLILLEQVYRAYMINGNKRYHR